MNDEEKKYLIEALDIGTHIPLRYIPNLYTKTLLPFDVAEYALHSNYACAVHEIEFLFVEHKNNDEFENLLTNYVNCRENQEKIKKYSIDFQRKPWKVD